MFCLIQFVYLYQLFMWLLQNPHIFVNLVSKLLLQLQRGEKKQAIQFSLKRNSYLNLKLLSYRTVYSETVRLDLPGISPLTRWQESGRLRCGLSLPRISAWTQGGWSTNRILLLAWKEDNIRCYLVIKDVLKVTASEHINFSPQCHLRSSWLFSVV